MKGKKPVVDIKVKEPKRKGKGKQRFLDFNITTSSVNSGSQMYGAGQTLHGNSGGDSRGGKQMGALKGGDIAPRTIRGGAKARFGGDQPGLYVPDPPESEMVGKCVVPDSNYNVLNDFVVQPGMDVTQGSCFEFIVPFAKLYEKYVIKELEFEYRPLVSAFDEGGKAGQVVLVYSYNALAGPPSDIVQALQSNPHVSGMANTSLRLRVNPGLAMDGGKYTRDSAVGMADVKTYDAGRLFVVCEGIPVTGREVGQIVVRYRIGFINPRPKSITSAPPNMVFNSYGMLVSGTVASTTGAAAMPLGAWVSQTADNPLAVVVRPGPGAPYGATQGFQLPKGCYLMITSITFYNSSVLNFGCAINFHQSTDAGATWAAVVGPASQAFSNQPFIGSAASFSHTFHVATDNYRFAVVAQNWTNANASNGTCQGSLQIIKLS